MPSRVFGLGLSCPNGFDRRVADEPGPCNRFAIAADFRVEMDTSVVIVSHNTCGALLRCLDSIAGTAPVCVVDNASTDGTRAAVRERHPGVRLVEMPVNAGFSAAVNRGAREVEGTCLLLLNPDTEVPPGGVARMERAFLRRPGAVAMGFRQVDAGGAFQLAVGPYPTFVTETLRRVVQRRLDAGQRWVGRGLDRLLSIPRPVAWVAGSSLLVRRADFDRIGGFDEAFFLYFEDIDFCLRLRDEKRQVWYDPGVTLLHHRGLSAKTSPALARRAYRRSQLYFWEKHHGLWTRRCVAWGLRALGRAEPVGRVS